MYLTSSILGVFFCLLVIIVFLCAGLALYFLPALIAYKRGHANKGAILIVNFLLGWTFIGWAGTLVWAFVDTDGRVADRALGNICGNKYDDLEKLQNLKDAGTISEEEFEKEKSKILK